MKRNEKGFTLIELMVVLLVIAILVAIALPSYNAYIQRVHRSHAKAALLRAAQWMERAATATGQYPTTLAAGFNQVEGGRYTVSLLNANAGSFTLTATRNNPGANANDKCGDFTVTSTGVRGTVNMNSSMTVADCWGR